MYAFMRCGKAAALSAEQVLPVQLQKQILRMPATHSPFCLTLGCRPNGSGLQQATRGGWQLFLIGDQPRAFQPQWETYLQCMEDGNWSAYSTPPAPHVLVAVHEQDARAVFLTDSRAQYPLFIRRTDGSLLLSTFLPDLLQAETPSFNPMWKLEQDFFNYPVLETTWLQGAERVAPRTCLCIDLRDCSTRIYPWRLPFQRAVQPLSGKEEIEWVCDTFNRVTSEYTEDVERPLISLTVGLDSQSILASVAEESLDRLSVFTYGFSNTPDVVGAKRIAQRYGVPHKWIRFDDELEDRLSQLLIETIQLSGGLEQVRRGILPFVYHELNQLAPGIVLSGISGDHVLRDHIRGEGNVPSIIPQAVMRYIQGVEADVLLATYKEEERDYLLHRLGALDETYGDLRSAVGYANFLMHECGPKYFGGEAAVARPLLPFCSIYWDERIVELLYQVQRSTIGLSTMYPGKDSFRESLLQCQVIRRNAKRSGHSAKGIPLSLITQESKPLYLAYSLAHRGLRKAASLLSSSSTQAAEKWNHWLNVSLNSFVTQMLLDEGRVSDFVNPELVKKAVLGTDSRSKGKLLSAEIILRLMERGWKSVSSKQ